MQICVRGTCKEDRNENALAWAGGWFPTDDTHNFSAKLPPAVSTAQAAELTALIVALRQTQTLEELVITSSSKCLIYGLTKRLPMWEDCGWIGIQNSKLLKKAAAELRMHGGDTNF